MEDELDRGGLGGKGPVRAAGAAIWVTDDHVDEDGESWTGSGYR